MQNIILCPKCRRQIKPDNLGELICPVCNLRLCPKNHTFDGKICPYCGHEDPNYSLYVKAQQARQQKRDRGAEETGEIKAQYICPQCRNRVDATQKHCNFCGLSNARLMAAKPTPAGLPPVANRAVVQSKPIWDSVPSEPKQKKTRESKSTFVREVEISGGTHFQFPPLKRFIRPMLASTLVGLVILGLVFGGIYSVRFISQKVESGAIPPITSVFPSEPPAKTYTLNISIVPQAGGEIGITPPRSASGGFEPGSQITLTAIPSDCYDFNFWDGAAESSENITITMESDKSLTANFKAKRSTPPVISQIEADSTSDVSATISWITDKPATGQIDYGKTKEYGLSALSSEELTTNHKVRVAGLEPNTTYYLLIKSGDQCGSETEANKMIITAREITYGERAGQRALDFTLPYYYDDNPDSPNKSGSETLSAYLGKKKILINFWSTFCGACIGEFPYIRGVYEDPSFANHNSADSDLVVLTICIDSKISEAPARIEILEDKFPNDAPFTFPILMDSVGQTKKDYHVWTLPETVFIDSDGIIREIKTGRFKDIDEIKAILNSLN
ncbi:MAG TPA: redoxin domain-containing protein [Dehalococcoidia bacterium]